MLRMVTTRPFGARANSESATLNSRHTQDAGCRADRPSWVPHVRPVTVSHEVPTYLQYIRHTQLTPHTTVRVSYILHRTEWREYHSIRYYRLGVSVTCVSSNTPSYSSTPRQSPSAREEDTPLPNVLSMFS